MWRGIALSAAVILCVAFFENSHAQSPAHRGQCTNVSIGSKEKKCIVPGSGLAMWFKDCDSCPEMVVVPRGALSAPPSAPNLAGQAEPSRTSFAKPFAVGRFAVTFEEWDACVDDRGCNDYRPLDQGWGRGNRPVINVSWHDAAAFTTWLSRKTGKSYRLLSGPEREYVARAGTTTLYWWGNLVDIDQANIDLPVPSRRLPGGDHPALAKVRHQTVPVDSYAPNPWGLYNVHGNVWEWTRDCLETSGSNTAGRQAGSQSTQCTSREARGGSWIDFAAEAASAARIAFDASSRNYAQGFRVARTLP